MTDPIDPTGKGPVGGPDGTESLDEATDVESAASTAATDAAAGARFRAAAAAAAQQNPGVDPLETAIGEVAADIRAGRVPDEDAAVDAVIIRLVNLRYGHLPQPRREKLVVQLHGLLHGDPRFRARIDQLIAGARA